MNHMTRISTLEYTCPLCRQIANCVLPVAMGSSVLKKTEQIGTQQLVSDARSSSISNTTFSSSSLREPQPTNGQSILGNTPAKMWILSSLAAKKTTYKIDTNNAASCNSAPCSSTSTDIMTNEPMKMKIFEKMLSQGDDMNSADNHIYESIFELLKSRPFSYQELVGFICLKNHQKAYANINFPRVLRF